MRAAAPACSLARALRALAGGLSKELALLGNASEIFPKTLPEASQSSLDLAWNGFHGFQEIRSETFQHIFGLERISMVS